MHEPARAPLRVVGCPDCEKFRKALDSALVDIANLETERKVARRRENELKAQIRGLKSDRHAEVMAGANVELIQRLWEFWRLHCRPEAGRNLGTKTMEAVRLRLADTVPGTKEPAYPPRYIAEAILGAKYDGWARDRGRDSLYEICQSPESLERFHRRYERHTGGAR